MGDDGQSKFFDHPVMHCSKFGKQINTLLRRTNVSDNIHQNDNNSVIFNVTVDFATMQSKRNHL